MDTTQSSHIIPPSFNTILMWAPNRHVGAVDQRRVWISGSVLVLPATFFTHLNTTGVLAPVLPGPQESP